MEMSMIKCAFAGKQTVMACFTINIICDERLSRYVLHCLILGA